MGSREKFGSKRACLDLLRRYSLGEIEESQEQSQFNESWPAETETWYITKKATNAECCPIARLLCTSRWAYMHTVVVQTDEWSAASSQGEN
jgi:hypothetical protein